jgi:catechol 2,3-dioxygenase-like lactoylglutathione lyase family enzyme
MPRLDHMIVPSHERRWSARFLADLLGVPWEPESMGMFSAVYVNESLTIDFGDAEDFDVHHYCFMVTDEEFDAILGRMKANGVPYRSSPHGPIDMQISTEMGGKNVYWFDDDGHNWEILTVSYARPESATA